MQLHTLSLPHVSPSTISFPSGLTGRNGSSDASIMQFAELERSLSSERRPIIDGNVDHGY